MEMMQSYTSVVFRLFMLGSFLKYLRIDIHKDASIEIIPSLHSSGIGENRESDKAEMSRDGN